MCVCVCVCVCVCACVYVCMYVTCVCIAQAKGMLFMYCIVILLGNHCHMSSSESIINFDAWSLDAIVTRLH